MLECKFICVCDCSVRKRITTQRPFTFDTNWNNVGTAEQKQSQTREKKTTQNTASGLSRTNSTQVSGSRVTRSQVALSSASRTDANDIAASSKKYSSSTSKVSYQHSAVSVMSSESANRAKRSTVSDARLSNAGVNSTKTKTTAVTDANISKTAKNNNHLSTNNADLENFAVSTSESSERLKNSVKSKDRSSGTGGISTAGARRKGANQSTAQNLKSNSRDPSRQNSASRNERGQQQVKSQSKNLVAKTNLTERHRISANVGHNAVFNISGIVETVGTGSDSVHHEAVNSGVLLTASRKTSANRNSASSIAGKKNKKVQDVNLNGVSSHTELSGRSVTGSVPVVNSSLSSVAVSQQSVMPLSSEAMASEHVSDAGVASVDVVTLDNQSHTRTRSASENRRAAENIHVSSSVASSRKAVSKDQASCTANVGVLRSGKKMVANRLNAASTRTESTSQVRQASAAGGAGPAVTSSQVRTR